MRINLLIFFVLIAPQLKGQESVAGFIIKGLEIENNVKMDFFLEAKIDSTLSVEDNLAKSKNDTLARLSLLNFNVGDPYPVKCEKGTLQVVAVRGVLGDWSIIDMFLYSEYFYSLPILIGGQTIINGYNPKVINSFVKLRRVKMANNTGKSH
jgi:hypothetical protein